MKQLFYGCGIPFIFCGIALSAHSAENPAPTISTPTIATPTVSELVEADAPELPAPTLAATLQDPRLNEVSGLAASRRYPGLFYAHNDSGDTARVFLMNGKGETVAVINLKGAYARDWEDITLAGNEVYVGDIGDNLGNRDAVQIYRFAEPLLDSQKINQTVEVAPQVCAFRFPGAPRDAETLLASPDGRIWILSKESGGSTFFSQTFQDKKTKNLQRAGNTKIRFGAFGIFTKLATGGDFSDDGMKLVVTTYAQIYEWKLNAPFGVSDLTSIKPVIRDLPGLKQCESVCYSSDGKQIFVSSEGKNAPLWTFKSAF
ncbi:hypothetical protein B1R32_10967 [Abditibacterium utsteinense]|uniref:Uncharacterized protein n=1 Tax=Abditibacterium utsteinense TaxID=1960156 RepID=A0A2S8SSG0_9BACT|nr:hypothetical protein [Abditibacterium utsteinense]PQV63727.1 hypothetical protein B1R32_10967 [Abditibacterium utsteinense]